LRAQAALVAAPRAPQEALAERVQVVGVVVVLAHEGLGGLEALARLVAETGGDQRLALQAQDVRLPAGGEMQLVAHAADEVVRRARLRQLAARSTVERAQVLEAATAVGCVCRP